MNNQFLNGLMEEVESAVEGATANKESVGWFACEACHKSYQASSMEETCPICGEAVRQWKGSTQVEALERMQKSVKLQQDEPKTDPKAEPKVDEREPLWKILNELGIKYSKRMKKETLQKLIETYEETPEVVEETPEVVEEVEQTPEAAPDYKALREKATLKFIKENKLNEISPVPVGCAEVQLIGFTIWDNKKPAFRFMQPFETPQMFQQEYNRARAIQPSCAIDVVQCNNVTNEELKKCLYNGNAIVSLNNGNGTTIARPGEIVELGALKTSTNHIRFVALKVRRN